MLERICEKHNAGRLVWRGCGAVHDVRERGWNDIYVCRFIGMRGGKWEEKERRESDVLRPGRYCTVL